MGKVPMGGSWASAGDGAGQDRLNPATLKPLPAAPVGSAEEVALATAAARRAQGDWSARGAEGRAAVLLEVGRALADRAPDIAELQAKESGQPYFECLEAALAAGKCFAKECYPDEGTQTHRNHPQVGWQATRTLMLAADYPLLHWASVAAPHLAAGGTLVCIAPRAMPLAVSLAAQCASALPAGVMTVLVARPESSSGAGGGRFGHEFGMSGAPAANDALDAIFISDRIEMDRTLSASASLRLFNSGQRPGQSARIYVEQRSSGEVADRLHEYLAFLECGDPSRPVTDLGPLRSAASLQRVEEQVGRALRRGALLKLGGRRYQPWGLRGYFFQPTLMIEGRGEERAPNEEIHGPVVIVSPVRNLAEAVTLERVGRMACFGRDLDVQLASLTAAGIEFETGATTTCLERIQQRFRGTRPAGLRIEIGNADEAYGFPYRSRLSLS